MVEMSRRVCELPVQHHATSQIAMDWLSVGILNV